MFMLAMRNSKIKVDGDKNASAVMMQGRLVLLNGFFILCYMLMAVRAFDLSIIQAIPPRTNDKKSSHAHLTNKLDTGVISSGIRGQILDRNGTLLAATIKTGSLYADPYLISNPKATAESLTKLFPDLSFGKVLQDLQSQKRFVWIKRNITPTEQESVLHIGEPGLALEYEQRRVYPQGGLFAHLLGYTDIDGHGLAGMERSFNNILNNGQGIDLSVDLRVQHAVKRELNQAMDDFSALAGVGIVMDVKTGEILAGVSLPDFDPHNPGDAGKNNLFNRMVLGVYELGSVFKIFSTAALLETKNIPMSTIFDAREPIKHGRFTINDYHAEDRVLTVPEVFMYSSNIGSAMMGEAVGTDKLKSFYHDLGLLTPPVFEMKEIGRPLVPAPWRDIHTLTAAYGHGLATTPLQVASALSTVVNGGFSIQPTLIKSADNNKRNVRVLSERTSEKMRKLLRLTVTNGTGKNADVPGYLVGGKTGTAEKATANGYDRDKLISSFAAVFPSHDPRYVVFVAVDEPKGFAGPGSYGYATAGWAAAPVVARIVKSMASVMGIEPFDVDEDPAESLRRYVSVKENEARQ